MDYVEIWRSIKRVLDGIPDPILRNTILVDLRKRAMRDWGFEPEGGTIAKNTTPALSDWEKEFVLDIRDCDLYTIDTRTEKRKKTQQEALSAMVDFVRNGGRLEDIPDDIRTTHITKLYHDVVHKEIDLLCQAADDLA